MFMAARATDPHSCPVHVSGVLAPNPALPFPRVLTEIKPQMCLGDLAICPVPVPPNAIVKGSTSVFAAMRPTARVLDMTAHGGVISMGAPTVWINR
jgi:uncharacterized Zn-binding protein involved in type VI secretion